jgi:hypothetical protein
MTYTVNQHNQLPRGRNVVDYLCCKRPDVIQDVVVLPVDNRRLQQHLAENIDHPIREKT